METPIKDSSNVAAVSHDPIKHVLTIRFKNSDSTYDYANVPKDMHRSLLKAESKGEWVNKHLVRKPNSHPATKREEKKKTVKIPPRPALMGNYQQPPME